MVGVDKVCNLIDLPWEDKKQAGGTIYIMTDVDVSEKGNKTNKHQDSRMVRLDMLPSTTLHPEDRG